MEPLLTTIAVIAVGSVAPRLESEAGLLFAAPRAALVCPAPTDVAIVGSSENLQTWAQGYLSAQLEVANRIDRISSEVLEYAELQDGWDGDGSLAPSSESVAKVIGLIGQLPVGSPLPKPMVSSSGEVGLYWRTEHFVADILVSDGSPSLFIRAKDGTGRELFLPELSDNAEVDLAKAFAQF
jgi:hypothetical protein